MILRMLILVLAFGSRLTSPLFAGAERGDALIGEAGGILLAAGIAGAHGVSGTPPIFDFSDFFALMPGDNSATVGVGDPVQFPQDGPTNGIITRIDASHFLLPFTGTYKVLFQVSVNEPGQLQLTLNGVPLAYTTVGRATGTSQLVGTALVTTVGPGVLEVINPVGNSTALTITLTAGGATSVSAHLVILRIQ
jgi:hypothetical protein